MIKAIETTYKGYRFRSRLEARWAVFFDVLRIEWEYEKEGFVVGPNQDVSYLPDFFLPESNTWVEVKGAAHLFDWHQLACAVDWGAGLPDIEESVGTSAGLLLLGPIPNCGPEVPIHPILQHHEGGWVGYASFTKDGLRVMNNTNVHFDSTWGRGNHEGNEWTAVVTCWFTDKANQNVRAWDIVRRAYSVARSARFEHGETPRIV